MEKYLVGIIYHDPITYEMWKAGVVEDYESSTGVFITAENESGALEWGEQIAQLLFQRANPFEPNSWKSFGYQCWIEYDWENSRWKHCLDFFQKVNYNEIPSIDKMGSDAYVQWQLESGRITQEEFDSSKRRDKKFAEWMENRQ